MIYEKKKNSWETCKSKSIGKTKLDKSNSFLIKIQIQQTK